MADFLTLETVLRLLQLWKNLSINVWVCIVSAVYYRRRNVFQRTFGFALEDFPWEIFIGRCSGALFVFCLSSAPEMFLEDYYQYTIANQKLSNFIHLVYLCYVSIPYKLCAIYTLADASDKILDHFLPRSSDPTTPILWISPDPKILGLLPTLKHHITQ